MLFIPVDAVDGKTKELVAMVHTHPDKGGSDSPSIYTGGSSDVSWQARNIPNKVGFVFGHSGTAYALTAWPNPGRPNNFTVYNLKKDFNITLGAILKGKSVDLRRSAYTFHRK